ncbi:thiamine pyrophosphate-dependent enzyme [Leifsonia sp. H3M29-4]|uniref:thiamine pyrophosphate-dependent enzyme n=1 Tax=Microbacteriaceae TaxID=85023 RepID=UPI00095A120F|nr:thiamine pyrophosphate-dependent enzyme [Salinibacterium metalliresistens]MAT83258.1 pyruvate dehydrogenase (acetyl-transferring) E1 component subunit alpha [Gammaproteobacteria bacterium]MBN9139231.1 pyruvate dehydrogenase (acetyl-transferring) E1 component subunit alpha [Micrococcales bacterium]MCB1297526.1 pyruvate dehydrogenase (acetyl-transferring) E1 component subunit alpha [Microthrixaceae bacterium]OJX66849.1 MAG: pyruvate dehydrogenase (acetyl-transferring) E1 component subunit alph
MSTPRGPALIRFLTPQGRYAPSRAAAPYAPLVDGLDTERLLSFYREMTLARRLDEASTALQRQGELALWIPSYGQEAAQTGSAHALSPLDTVFPSYREHGVALARGIDFVDILAVLRGNTFRGWDPERTRFRLYTIVLAAQALHAAGYAMGISLDQQAGRKPPGEEAVIVYIGDGAMSEGDASEALTFARTYDAPVLFFVQNNQYAISTPASTQTAVSYATRAKGFGIPGHRIDGNDVLASYAVTKHVMDAVRAGGGPALIEAVTYRLGPHTSSDDPTKYRTVQERSSWERRDPIPRLRAHLSERGVTDDVFESIDAHNAEHAGDVRRRLIALPAPDPGGMFDHVYSDAHPVAHAQKAWLRDYLDSFEDAAE